MTVRIISTDGFGAGTKVIDLATGLEVRDVVSLSVNIQDADSLVQATLKVQPAHLEIMAHDVSVSIPWKEYKRLKTLAGEEV